jgi:hypothetical protein
LKIIWFKFKKKAPSGSNSTGGLAGGGGRSHSQSFETVRSPPCWFYRQAVQAVQAQQAAAFSTAAPTTFLLLVSGCENGLLNGENTSIRGLNFFFATGRSSFLPKNGYNRETIIAIECLYDSIIIIAFQS